MARSDRTAADPDHVLPAVERPAVEPAVQLLDLETRLAAIEHLLQTPRERLGDGLFNIGGEWSPTVLEMTECIASRVQAATGVRPSIERREAAAGEVTDSLTYRIAKLAATGFRPAGTARVDDEIDGVVRFCMAQTW